MKPERPYIDVQEMLEIKSYQKEIKNSGNDIVW